MDDAEVQVITAVLKDKQIHVLQQSNMTKFMKTYGDVWEFISSYHNKNGSLPPEGLVTANYPDFKVAEDVGSTKHHLELLQAQYVDDTVRSILRDAATLVQNGSAGKAIVNLVNDANCLKKDTSIVSDLNLEDVDNALTFFKRVREANNNGGYGITTGFPSFDSVLPSGISEGFYGCFLAYPGIGKSWMALHFAVSAWRQGKSPLIVSLEMSHNEVRNRLLTILGNGKWTLTDLSRGLVDEEEFLKWHTATFDGRPPFNIVSTEGIGEITPAVLAGKISQYKCDFLVLDYLQLCSPNAKVEGEVARMKALSRELKMLAQSTTVPILAVSSATPTDATKMSEPPTLGQAAYSRQISYDVDFMLAMGREPTSDVMEITFRKNRHGPSTTWYVQCDFNRGIFRVVTDVED